MVLKIADRVFETSNTQGTVTLNLSGPVQGFRSFAAAFATSDKIPYVISDDVDWEIGVGTLTEGSPDQLSRDTVYSSSNAGSLVNWGSGTRNVRVGPIADLIYHRTENKNVIIGKGTATGDGTTHNVTMDINPLAYETGMELTYLCPTDVTGALNVNVGGLGNKAVKRNGADLQAGDFLEDDVCKLFYTGVHFESLLLTRFSDSEFASQPEAEAGVATDKPMNALRTKQAIEALVPEPIVAGAMAMWPTDTAPTGWLERDGSAISRTTYADLFAVIGEDYGVGDGSTTFNLPDDRGLFERGWDNGRGYDSGRTFGSYQADAVKSHTHTGSTDSGGSHTHTQNVSTGGGGSVGASTTSLTGSQSSYLSTGSGGTHSHSFTTAATGGTENLVKNRAYLPIIKY